MVLPPPVGAIRSWQGRSAAASIARWCGWTCHPRASNQPVISGGRVCMGQDIGAARPYDHAGHYGAVFRTENGWVNCSFSARSLVEFTPNEGGPSDVEGDAVRLLADGLKGAFHPIDRTRLRHLLDGIAHREIHPPVGQFLQMPTGFRIETEAPVEFLVPQIVVARPHLFGGRTAKAQKGV